MRIGEDDKDGNATIVADLHICDRGLIDRIESGSLAELSCGYRYQLDIDGGRLIQRRIRINHVACVPRGRAGVAKINDEDGEAMTNERLDKIATLLEKLLGLEAEPATDSADRDLIAVTPKSAATMPGRGEKPAILGTALTSAPKSEVPIHPIAGTSATTSATGWKTKSASETPDAVGPARLIDALRSVRAAVADSGSPEAIVAFNAAMKSAKAKIGLATAPQSAFDDTPAARVTELSGVFENAVRDRRAQMLGEAVPERSRFCRPAIITTATDRDEVTPTYQEQIASARERMLGKWRGLHKFRA